MRLVVDSVAEPEPLQHADRALANGGSRALAGELNRHLDVLIGGQGFEQIVHLKDKADIAPHPHQIARAKAR